MRAHRTGSGRAIVVCALMLAAGWMSGAVPAAAVPAVTVPAAAASAFVNVLPAEPINRFTATDGQALYGSICQACHMPDAKGARGAGMFPALAGNAKLTSAVYPAYVVLHGLHGMPSFANDLNDAQIAAVANYVVTHFGNHAHSPITPEGVKALRPALP